MYRGFKARKTFYEFLLKNKPKSTLLNRKVLAYKLCKLNNRLDKTI